MVIIGKKIKRNQTKKYHGGESVPKKKNQTKKQFRKVGKLGGSDVADNGIIMKIIETKIDSPDKYNEVEARIKQMIDNGFDINSYINAGLTPLLYACELFCKNPNPNIKMLEILLNNGADVNKRSLTGKDTPLLFSLKKNLCSKIENIVEILIDYGADVNLLETNGKQQSPLHIACYQDDYNDIVEILLKKNANVNATDIDNVTPLHLACASHEYESLKLLLEKNIDVNVINIKRDTPLHYVCNGFSEDFDISYKFLRRLLRKGANINALNDVNHTPLMVLFDTIDDTEEINKFVINEHRNKKYVYVELVKYFIKKGANINITDDDNENALFQLLCTLFAFEEGCYRLCKELFINNLQVSVGLINEVLGYEEITPRLIGLLIKKGGNMNLIIDKAETEDFLLIYNIIKGEYEYSERCNTTIQNIIDRMKHENKIFTNSIVIPDSFGGRLPFIEEITPYEIEQLTTLSSRKEVEAGFDILLYKHNKEIKEHIEEEHDNALIIYYENKQNNMIDYECSLTYKTEHIVEGYLNRSNIFYRCKNYNHSFNYEKNVFFNKPLYKIDVGELVVYVSLRDVLKMIKSNHKFWLVKKTKTKIESVCSRLNLINDQTPGLNYDRISVNISSGNHCQADIDANGKFLKMDYLYDLIPVKQIIKNMEEPNDKEEHSTKKRKVSEES
jgi:ankyrin repeat protein